MTNGTWEVEIENGGTDRLAPSGGGSSAQTFYDVGVFGRPVGSTNTAMTMAAVLLFLLWPS